MTNQSETTVTSDDGANKRIWPIEMVINAAFEQKPLPSKVHFQLALQRIETYAEAAQTQAARLSEPVEAYLKEIAASEPSTIPHWPGAQLAADAHYYFICWDSVAKGLDTLRNNAAGLTTPRKVWRKYRDVLEHYQSARDHLEHYPERLPMGKHSTWQHSKSERGETVRGDPGAVRLGGIFTLNGQEWDLSRDRARILESLWQDLIGGLRAETEVRFNAWLNGKPFSGDG